MTVVRFPPRRTRVVLVCREREGFGWLTIAGAHGWIFASIAEARAEARWLARNLGLPIREHWSACYDPTRNAHSARHQTRKL
jgi:hypothetical protein